jgi:hypothetical protein
MNNIVYLCEPPNAIKHDLIKKYVRYLYYLVIDDANTNCNDIRNKLSSLWFVLYVLVILFILLVIIYIISILMNTIFKFEKINNYPPTHKAVEEMLLAAYVPNKANDYIDHFETKKKVKKAQPEKVEEEEEVEENEEDEDEEEQIENCHESIPPRFKLNEFLDDDQNEQYNYYYRPPPCLSKFPLSCYHDYEFIFPVVPEEHELHMKLLLAQLTSQNHSVENSKIYKFIDKNKFLPKKYYKKTLKFALKHLK